MNPIRATHCLPALAPLFAAAWLVACSPTQRPDDGVPETAVSVTDAACVPNEIRVREGRNRFIITNASMRPLEWEILDGVMVVDERENIAPGFVQTLTARLRPGSYVMTCGLLTNPRGTLTVEADPDADKAAPAPLAFVSAQAEYKVYVHQRTQEMLRQVAEFADVLRSGDIAAARDMYAASRQAWQALAPVAQLLSAPYDRLEGQPALYAGGATDPAFVGWHRIEALLFGNDADAAQLAALANTLQADAQAFAGEIDGAKIDASQILSSAATAAGRIATRKLRGLDNPHASGSDLRDARANLAGLRRIAELFSGALSEHAPERLAEIDTALTTLETGLATPSPDNTALEAQAIHLSGAFSSAAAQLGL